MTRERRLHAVMFDMDGLLVDTEPLWFEAEIEIMARLGGTWSHADQAHLVGGSLARSVAYLLAKAAPVPPDGAAGPRQWPPSAATVGDWLVDAMVDSIGARGAPPMPGAAGLLADLAAAGLPCALVTSSQRRVMDAVLAQLAGAHGRGAPDARPPSQPDSQPHSLFDVTVCADDVTHAKPHPEPYLLAARLLGADPARCVVLEDAPNGVEAAEAAGAGRRRSRRGCGAARDGRIVVSSLGWCRPDRYASWRLRGTHPPR